jgi:hypothetical protein
MAWQLGGEVAVWAKPHQRPLQAECGPVRSLAAWPPGTLIGGRVGRVAPMSSLAGSRSTPTISGAKSAVLIFRRRLLWRSSTPSMEEVAHLLHADRAVLVRIHRFEDAFVSCLKLLQGDGSIAIAVHQRKNDAHGERPRHASLPHGVLHPALSPSIVPAHALPHALPYHPVAACTGFALVHRVLLRLFQLLHVRGIGIVLGDGGYAAAHQNGCGGRDH